MDESLETPNADSSETTDVRLGTPSWMKHQIDSYANMTLSLIKKLKLPVELNERILKANDPYGVILNADARMGLPYYEIALDAPEQDLAELEALLELDAAGVRMDIVHELIWPGGGRVGASPVALLSAYRDGGNLALQVDYLQDFDQHLAPDASIPQPLRTDMQRDYDKTVTYEWVNDLISKDPARALFVAATVMDDQQFAHAASEAPAMAARFETARTGPEDPSSSRRDISLGARSSTRKGVDARAAGGLYT